MEDKKITELFLARDGSAVNLVIEKYGAYLHAIARNILGDERDAEECVNDTYMAAWNSIPPNKPVDLRTYLSKLCRRAAMKRVRDNSAEKRGGGQLALALDEIEEVIPGEADDNDAEEIRRVLNKFLSSLPGGARRVFVLRYYEMQSIDYIADKCGFTQGAVKMSLTRSREKLRKMLEKERLL